MLSFQELYAQGLVVGSHGPQQGGVALFVLRESNRIESLDKAAEQCARLSISSFKKIEIKVINSVIGAMELDLGSSMGVCPAVQQQERQLIETPVAADMESCSAQGQDQARERERIHLQFTNLRFYSLQLFSPRRPWWWWW